MDELLKEKETLKETLKTVEKLLIKEKDEYKKIFSNFSGSREELWDITDRMKIHIKNLEVSLDKPYFARIDFTYDDDNKTQVVYIGKNGIMDDTNIVVTDWRAPISSLYYDAEVGKCSFEAPEGIITGNMDLKRQYEIEKGELLEYFDVDLVSNDSLLQKYLNTNNDSRLKSIVATIQKEQNEVIRKALNDNLIIQGVAGSGKTTVALHRIAYLVYNYMKSIKQNQYLVIGPNPVFIKYIKSVLPDLDVSGVEQNTFEGFAKTYIGEDININSSDRKVNASISGKLSNDVDKFKSSMKYKNMIEKFLNLYFHSITSKDLMIDGFKVLSSKKISEIFESTNGNFNTSLNSRIEVTIDKLCKYISERNDRILSNYNDYSYELFEKATNENDRNKLRKKFAKEREEIKKDCRSTIRKYFNKATLSITKLYRVFIDSIKDFDIYGYENIDIIKKQTSANIKKNNYDFEDLAALMYIKQMVSPDRDYNKYKHVVIDEAQDLGEFNFYVLKNILPFATFSIFGDLAQSIYDYRGVDNWEDVNSIMFDNKGSIVHFNKSYRTTSQIMNVADEVSDSIGLGKSDLVVRQGNPVSFNQVEEKDNIPSYIIKKIQDFKDKGYKTIAVISKTELMSYCINDDLIDNGLSIPNISISDDLTDDRYSVCTISNQLAKGLEFDAVIVNGASEEIYSSNSSLDMKLLYVAITRALHELDIIYSGEITKPLQKFLTTKHKV